MPRPEEFVAPGLTAHHQDPRDAEQASHHGDLRNERKLFAVEELVVPRGDGGTVLRSNERRHVQRSAQTRISDAANSSPGVAVAGLAGLWIEAGVSDDFVGRHVLRQDGELGEDLDTASVGHTRDADERVEPLE